MTPTERRLIAQIAAHESWAATPDRAARTAPARAGLEAKFLAQAGGDAARAESLRKAHYKRPPAKGHRVIAAHARRIVEDLGLRPGTTPENLAAIRLHRAGHDFVQQHRVGRYVVDFAFLKVMIAVEIDGPHHHRPDVAHKDALRDAVLRSEGWIILRVNTGPFFEEQLSRVSRFVHAAMVLG